MCTSVENASDLCTKCCGCCIGFPLTVKLLFFTRICHHFMCKWSVSFSSSVHAQTLEFKKFLFRKCLESLDTGIVKS